MSKEVQLTIPKAPDFLFKKEKTDNILNERAVVYLIEKMEAVEHYGMCIYYKNVPYPKKGFPSPESLYALNQIKKIILETSKHFKNPFLILAFLTLDKNKLMESFNIVFYKIFGNFVMKDEFMCRSAFNFSNFVHGVLISMGYDNTISKEFAFNLGQILEFDDAYRYRFQDIMEELNEKLFVQNPTKELKRLISIFKERTTDGVYSSKLKYLLSFIVLFVPFIKKHLIKNVNFLIECKRDKADWYWVSIKVDNYLYNGMTVDERQKQFKERPIMYETMA